jgi:hypothetical protein
MVDPNNRPMDPMLQQLDAIPRTIDLAGLDSYRSR